MTKISERDYELLSAFLDGALNAEDTSRLKARLESDPELKAAFEKLQTTRAVLRSAPSFRVPRNFTLTPEMIGRKQSGFFSYNLMRLTSVLASVLFVIIVMGDVVGTSLLNFGQMNETATFQSDMAMEELAGIEMEERAVEGETIAAEPEEVPEVLAMEEPAADVGDGENGWDEDLDEEVAPQEIQPSEAIEKAMVPEAEAEEELNESEELVLEEAPSEIEGGGEILATPTPTIEPQNTIEPTPEPTAEPTPTMPEPTPTEEEFLVQIPTEPIIEPVEEQDDPMRFFRFLILAVEFGLGGIAIGAGVTAFLMRKRS